MPVLVDLPEQKGGTMQDRIRGSLEPVRRRQLGILLIQAATWGLIAGSVVGVSLGVTRLFGRPVSPALALACLIGAPVLALIVGAMKGRSIKGAASAVDAHYHLKDRARTALDFLAKAEPTDLHKLQLEDAENHLAQVKAAEVAPFRLPRKLAYAGSLLVLAITLLVWPVSRGKTLSASPAEPIESIVQAAETTIERLKQIDALVKSERDPDLEKLVKELMAKAEEMKQPGVDQKEALAKLSEMQAAIAAQQAQYNVGLVDAQLQSLGAAMQAAAATDAAGSALQEGKFDQAVKELEKLEAPPVDKKEAKTLEEKLRQVAQEMGNVGLGQMSDAATEMAEGAKGGSQSKFKNASRTLANLTKGHAGRRRIKTILDGEVESLSECKGQCNSEFARKGKKPSKSDSSSENWGAATSGNVLGDKTKLQSNRKVEEITGNPGDGPSEMETTHSPEGKEKATRTAKENYQKYKKMSEDVLDSEPIPLGHRQAIRKYFELIRPAGAEGAGASKDAPAAPDAK
jgi:hypothetical protein